MAETFLLSAAGPSTQTWWRRPSVGEMYWKNGLTPSSPTIQSLTRAPLASSQSWRSFASP